MTLLRNFSLFLFSAFFALTLFAQTAKESPVQPLTAPNWGENRWKDLPENPLIGNEYKKPEMAIGDPQVLIPGNFDDKWHVFFHGFGFGPGESTFFHQISEDGIHWTEVDRVNGEIEMQNLFCDGDRWIQYYTCTTRKAADPELKKKGSNTIRARTTKDFVNWTEPVDLIYPETPAERDGYNVQARNPCVILLPDGRYRLYYSAGTVHLRDAGYGEPKYIFCAESDNPLGPFKKLGDPILSPDVNLPYRNYGCGAIKVFGYGKGYIAFYNPIYIDSNQKSRSEIRMLFSDDGLQWKEADCNPVVKPDPKIPWRSAIVYQLDVVHWKDTLLMYFNAREGWRGGVERIGAVRLDLNGDAPVVKLQKPFNKK